MFLLTGCEKKRVLPEEESQTNNRGILASRSTDENASSGNSFSSKVAKVALRHVNTMIKFLNVMYFLPLIAVLGVISCEKSDPTPAYGLFDDTRVRSFYKSLESLENFVQPDTGEYAFYFDGIISEKRVNLKSDNPSTSRFDRTNPYFKVERSLRLISSLPYVSVGNAEGAVPFVSFWFSYTSDQDIRTDLRWDFTILDSTVVSSSENWIDQVLTSVFIPGEVMTPNTMETLDSLSLGLAPDFTMQIQTPNNQAFSMEQSPLADNHRSIKCLEFIRSEESDGIRYKISFEAKHGISGGSYKRSPSYVPIEGIVRINHFEPY